MVNVIEVLLILALFCTGDVRDQLMFCFELFDDDNSDSMDQEEMTNFLWVLASASNKIGLVDPMPTRREVHKVAGGMFALADVGNKGTESGLSSQHFINWAQNHVIGSAILDSVEKVGVRAASLSDNAVLPCTSGWQPQACCSLNRRTRVSPPLPPITPRCVRMKRSTGEGTSWTHGRTQTSSQLQS